MSVEPVRECQGCGRATLLEVIDLGHQPPVHALLSRDQLEDPEVAYPLRLLRCSSCGLVQLGHVVDPRIVFPREYPYLTGITPVMRTNFREMAAQAAERLGLREGDLVIDIGSNDGTLLEGFRERGARVLGVEPTDVADVAIGRGIPTVNAFFGQAVADAIRDEHGPARVVTATNVIGHIPDIAGVLRAIRSLLSSDGAFISESHYLLDLIDGLQYDTLYHEHLRYYSLRPFVRLMERAGLCLYDASRIRTHGGSIRVWAAADTRPRSEGLDSLLRAEDERGLHEAPLYDALRTRIFDQKARLQQLLLAARSKGARVAGLGAPARAGTLLNFCRVDTDLMQFIREQDTSAKVGLFMPQCHIPIVGEQALIDRAPDHAVVLSWHIADDVMASVRARGYRGSFILPLPEPTHV